MADFLEAIRHEYQSKAAAYQSFEATPVSGAIGVEVDGLDLSRSLPDATLGELREALLNHLVLFFRDQTLTPRQFAALAARFGELHVVSFGAPHPGVPQVMLVSSEENETLRFAGKWHSDVSWDRCPAMGSLLYAVEVPEFGGDTLFSNMYLAYLSLSESMRGVIAGLRALHTASLPHEAADRVADLDQDLVSHPIVRTHPETGDKALFVNEYFTSKIEGMTDAESEPLLKFLCAHAARPDFCCRFQWRAGSLAFWDNRCTQHYATSGYPDVHRLMQRITIVGDEPY